MPTNPKVSICIPSFNHARFLAASIESALAQTFTDFEVVIVDDGSTDDSFQIAESYAARYPAKVRVFTHPDHRNRGISETVNLGFRLSRGEYYSGLPSDDCLYPDKIEKQVAFLDERPEFGWVYGYADYIDELGRQRPDLGLFGEDITGAANPLSTLIQGNVIPGMSVLARRSCVEKVGEHDPSLVYSDWEFWVRMLALYKAAFLDRPLVMYRVHTYNTSVGIDSHVNLNRYLEVLTSLRRKAPDSQGDLAQPRIQAFLDLQLAYYHFLEGDSKAARLSLRSAFTADSTLAKDPLYLVHWLKQRIHDVLFTFQRPILVRRLLGAKVEGGLRQLKRSFVHRRSCF
jgi:glycosyltransferase involved in cell wall biosynthesis